MLKISRPQWKASLYYQATSDSTVLVLDETEHTLLTGRAFPLLIPHLDGTHTLSDLIALLARQVTPPELIYSLQLLEQKQCIIESDTEADPGIAAFWHRLNLNSKQVDQKLYQTAVSVDTVGHLTAAPIRAALEALHVRVADHGEFHVVVTDDYLHDELTAINRQMLDLGRPWMLMKPVGRIVWVGPIFRRVDTGCWQCLATRLRLNRQLESFLQRQTHNSKPLPLSTSAFPSHVRMIYELAATELLKALVLGASPVLDGTVVSLDTQTLATKKHQLTRRPQCVACGNPEIVKQRPRTIILSRVAQRFNTDSGYRTLPPQLTYETYKHHISPITGVVTALERFEPQADSGLTYSYSAGHNFAMAADNLLNLMMNIRSRSGGKGTTDIQAKVSAVCEAIERYSGVWRGDEATRTTSFAELGDEALHPNDLMRFSETQYQNRPSWNEAHASHFHRVPEPFDPQRQIDWTPVWSLTHQRVRYVPSAYVYYGHPDFAKSLFCTCDANGNAAGNTIEEAILQGFMELVERDAVCLWWYNRVPRPRIDLQSFNDPYIDALQAYYKSINRDLWVLDITSDLEIPAFAAVSRRTDKTVEDILLGFGAHFDPRIALLRALTEINQFLPTVAAIDGEGNTVYWFHDPTAISWWKTATLESEPYLVPDDSVDTRSLPDFPRHTSDMIVTDVETCVHIAAQHGLETFVIDQTQPDIGLSVVKVIVPGLRHFWKRFGSGRLYDVPVKLGWLDTPRAEEDLNPLGIFF